MIGNTNFSVSDFIFVNQSIGYAVSLQGKMKKTSDGGAIWTSIQVPTTRDILCVDFKDENNGVIGTDSGYVFKTTNGGFNWVVSIKLTGTQPKVTDITYIQPTTIVALNYRNGIARTTNNGDNWIVENMAAL